MNLSKAQKRVLWHMVNGWFIRRYVDTCSLNMTGSRDAFIVTTPTMRVLLREGLVYQSFHNGLNRKYHLTEKGADFAKTITDTDL